MVPLPVDLRAARESDADELQLTFAICWALCLGLFLNVVYLLRVPSGPSRLKSCLR